MRIFAISDLHVDFNENCLWVSQLSKWEYQEDILIMAGDISHLTKEITKTFSILKKSFKEVFFVPGNHDLWTEKATENSWQKYQRITKIAQNEGIKTQTMNIDNFTIIPLLSWYDFSFGALAAELRERWMDFFRCHWPDDIGEEHITKLFLEENILPQDHNANYIITFSHFLPRIDIMPDFISAKNRLIYPLLGTIKLDKIIRELKANIHIYGHSHVNRQVEIDKVLYINNAFGYPHETQITAKKLVNISEKFK